LGKGFDPLITIRNAAGRQVRQCDNNVGLFFDCRFEHQFAEAGRHTIEIRDSRYSGSDGWAYVLRMGKFPAARVALPSAIKTNESGEASPRFPELGNDPFSVSIPSTKSPGLLSFAFRRDGDEASAWVPLLMSDLSGISEREPNETLSAATAVSIPGILHGQIGARDDRDCFAFDLKKGENWSFRAESRALGSPADLVMLLSGPDGKELKRADDFAFNDAAFNFTAKTDGRHTLLVRELIKQSGPEYVYRVLITRKEPAIHLTSAVTRLAVPQGTYQPLPLELKRSDFSGPVQLSLVGAPKGVRLKSTEIPAGINALENSILVDSSAVPGIYTLQIRATGQMGDRKIQTVAATLPLIDRLPTGRGPHGEPFERREDQTRLPPTLTDRVALLILPPAPFDFELASAVFSLPRFLEGEFQIDTTRHFNFETPIQFVARGGPLELDGLKRRNVTPTIPQSIAGGSSVVGKMKTTVLARVAKHWITLTGTAAHEGHTVSLSRRFQLDVCPAFHPTVDVKSVSLKPGESATVRLSAGRIKPFDGPVTVNLSQVAGLSLPNSVTVPAGHADVEIPIKIAAETKPGTHKISLSATARVARFQEQSSGEPLEVIVVGK